jgi:hypothetical protein
LYKEFFEENRSLSCVGFSLMTIKPVARLVTWKFQLLDADQDFTWSKVSKASETPLSSESQTSSKATSSQHGLLAFVTPSHGGWPQESRRRKPNIP